MTDRLNLLAIVCQVPFRPLLLGYEPRKTLLSWRHYSTLRQSVVAMLRVVGFDTKDTDLDVREKADQAFQYCRAFLAQNAAGSNSQQFRGLTGLMRGCASAFFVATWFYLGWGVVELAQTAGRLSVSPVPRLTFLPFGVAVATVVGLVAWRSVRITEARAPDRAIPAATPAPVASADSAAVPMASVDSAADSEPVASADSTAAPVAIPDLAATPGSVASADPTAVPVANPTPSAAPVAAAPPIAPALPEASPQEPRAVPPLIDWSESEMIMLLPLAAGAILASRVEATSPVFLLLSPLAFSAAYRFQQTHNYFAREFVRCVYSDFVVAAAAREKR